MSDSISAEQLRLRIERANEEIVGRCGDEFEFRTSDPATAQGAVEVYFRHEGTWVTRVPAAFVSIEMLDAVRAAVSTGRAQGRVDGKREIGDFLRQECGL